MKNIKTVTHRVMTVLNVIAIFFLLLIAYSGYFNPQQFPTLATLGLSFPYVLAVNVAFLVFWLLFRWRSAWLPALGLLLCMPVIRLYAPLNIPWSPPEGAIKVLTYNVRAFGNGEAPDDQSNPVVDYIIHSNADIVCVQEAAAGEEHYRWVDKRLKKIYPYTATDFLSTDWIRVFSRFPIKKKHIFRFPVTANATIVCILDINGEEVAVLSNHLESLSLTADELGKFEGILDSGVPNMKTLDNTRYIFNRVKGAVKARAQQADLVAEYVAQQRERGRSVIVCGDFNDSPISYPHHTVGKGLTDCFAASGNGFGWSYNRHGIFVRIDHIFCSDDWEPFGATVDTKALCSDHFPVYCWLKKR